MTRSFMLTIALAALPWSSASAQAAQRDARVAAAAEALRPVLVAMRRDLHMHPELSNREERTARVVAEQLRKLGLDEVKEGVGRHGVVALLKGALPGPVVAVRADMDALPIQETIDVPYKSQNPGVKHACGHDVHTAVQLGVAEVLAGMRKEVRGSIKFIFQPAEEGPPPGEPGGAKLMIAEGVLDNPRPAAIFGLHTLPSLEVGQIGYHSGPAMASSDRLYISIRGKRAHGAQPHLGTDAIVIAAESITALQTIHSRRSDPLEPLVLTLGTIHGGDRYNVIAEEVKLEGTMRTFNEEIRQRALDMVRQTLEGVTAAHGASFELKVGDNNPLTYNDPALVEATLPSMRRILGDQNVLAPKPLMPAEDFSYYQKVIPGFFYFLGVGNQKKGITAALHTGDYDVDEDSLPIGVKVMATVLMDFLERGGKR